jgi:hypothetical protein
VTIALLFVAAFASSARAQFDYAWVSFVSDQNRLRDSSGGPATAVMTSTAEKDMAWGDLDNDGWTDLVIVTSWLGPTSGFLLMNRQGVLVDRTAFDAVDSNVPGDQGFLTPTVNRDVAIADVNQDGWLDVITSTWAGDPATPVSLPRIYMNKGLSAQGVWLGLRFEYGRIPAFMGTGAYADATGVAAGDVTGDGFPDLFFETRSGRDSLLINDGTGSFTNSGTTRMSSLMLGIGNYWGANVKILDVNGDGLRDIVRCKASPRNNIVPSISIAYNDPNNVGYFPQALWSADVGQTYAWHVDIGDLNQDGFLDIVFPRDANDGLRYGTGFDAQNRLTFGPILEYLFVTGADDGFGGTNLIADLNNDGWKDVIQTDRDLDVGGCTSRCHIYHNSNSTPGVQARLIEEAGSPEVPGVSGRHAGDGSDRLLGRRGVRHRQRRRSRHGVRSLHRDVRWMNHLVTGPTVTAVCFGDGTGAACRAGISARRDTVARIRSSPRCQDHRCRECNHSGTLSHCKRRTFPTARTLLPELEPHRGRRPALRSATDSCAAAVRSCASGSYSDRDTPPSSRPERARAAARRRSDVARRYTPLPALAPRRRCQLTARTTRST